jgi:uncharacterized protein
MLLAQTLTILAETFAISRLDKGAPIPSWASLTGSWSVTGTDDELSICPDLQVAADVISNRGWKCIKVAGPPDFALTGVLASLFRFNV